MTKKLKQEIQEWHNKMRRVHRRTKALKHIMASIRRVYGKESPVYAAALEEYQHHYVHGMLVVESMPRPDTSLYGILQAMKKNRKATPKGHTNGDNLIFKRVGAQIQTVLNRCGSIKNCPAAPLTVEKN